MGTTCLVVNATHRLGLAINHVSIIYNYNGTQV